MIIMKLNGSFWPALGHLETGQAFASFHCLEICPIKQTARRVLRVCKFRRITLMNLSAEWTNRMKLHSAPIQRRFDFSGVLYFGWPNQPSSGTMRVYIGLLLCTYIYIVNGC